MESPHSSPLPDPTATLHAHWDRPVYAWLAWHAERTPDRVALGDGQTIWSYRELEQRSNQLAHYLLRHGLRPQELVAINAQRNAGFVWALLGVLKAGCAFTVLDAAFPPSRMQHCLRVARPRVVLRLLDDDGPSPDLKPSRGEGE